MSEKKDEFSGLRKVLERYSYIDDLVSELTGMIPLLDSYRAKISTFLTRRDISLSKKKELIEIIKNCRDNVARIVGEIKDKAKVMSVTEKRMKIQELINCVRNSLKKVDSYV